MRFPVVIHKDAGSTYGVIVPDIPGCHSWGETIESAIDNTQEAIKGHIETLLEMGQTVEIKSSKIEELSKEPEYTDGTWVLVDVDLSKIDTKPERINISIPRFVLTMIDDYVAKRHETRSGFLARAALNVIGEEEKSSTKT